MNLEYVIVKIWRRNASENVQVSNKMVCQINVATDNVMSQCFSKCTKSSDNSYIYSYWFNVLKKSEVFL